MQQQSLTFEPHTAYRRTDPDTSRAAAEQHTGARVTNTQRVAEAVERWPGRTSHELSEASGMDYHEVARRTSDAARKGLIVRGASRECRVSGNRATAWWPEP